MNRIITILLLISFSSSAQKITKDSLVRALELERVDTNRALLLAKLGNVFKDEDPITGLNYAKQGIILSRKIGFLKGEATCLNTMGSNFRRLGDFSKGLQAHFDALKIFEGLKNFEGITYSYHGISVNYEDRGDYHEALAYANKVIPAARILNNQQELMYIQANLGKIYEKLGQLDSALHYIQNAYAIAISTNDFSILGNILSRTGNIYVQLGNPEMAFAYYKMGIPIAIAHNDYNSLTELYFDKAALFRSQSNFDSSLYFAKKDLEVAKKMPLPTEIVRVANFLAETYHNINSDSAYKYLALATNTKDSMFSHEKLKQLQILAFEEETRQEIISEELAKEKLEQSHRIQYIAMGILILFGFILFLLLSNSILASEKSIKSLGLVILLIIFEFINLILHPTLLKITGYSPSLLLLAMVVIASVLVPFHHKLDNWIEVKMVKKHKQIRLEGAKKILAELEKNPEEDKV